MIDRETWLILAERCATIRRLHEACMQEEGDPEERITLVFDSHDQATVLTVEPR